MKIAKSTMQIATIIVFLILSLAVYMAYLSEKDNNRKVDIDVMTGPSDVIKRTEKPTSTQATSTEETKEAPATKVAPTKSKVRK